MPRLHESYCTRGILFNHKDIALRLSADWPPIGRQTDGTKVKSDK